MILHFTMLFALTQLAASQNPAPCPDIFSYEPREDGSDRWYGKIQYSATNNLTGIWLQILLDKPADILGNWFGQITTCDNTAYVIRKPGYVLQVGQYLSLRFFVKFNLAKPIPSLMAIKLNGNDICAEQTNKPNNVDSELVDNDQVVKLTSMPSSNARLTVEFSTTDLLDEAIPSCGISASRAFPLIYEGQETSPGQWPWHAALYHHESFEVKYSCGATLITRQHVVTAAHCVSDIGTKTVKDVSDISIGLGKYDLKTYEENFQHVGLLNIFVHPKYNPWKSYNDIAVLKLSSPVQITDYVRPSCLWDGDSNLENIIGREGMVVGWGLNENYSHRLTQAAMPIVSTRDCISSKKEFREFLNENNFCAGDRKGNDF
ncbi:limulus clotting factor C-like isoform X1 [Anoplophora glabripennis]|uniref:limulus clotting factor C-like isoform X1 n=1 Tax=Anoplophora glabripennis TaxID=217634 RepID=UPI000874520A|nr:limulus clotting factor C-like isoform X1 [Anoplophora glabripennis]XP_018571195.1 limulus clotting factor C-like isoform X1 [Anoplophora glabripennis]